MKTNKDPQQQTRALCDRLVGADQRAGYLGALRRKSYTWLCDWLIAPNRQQRINALVRCAGIAAALPGFNCYPKNRVFTPLYVPSPFADTGQ